MKAGGNGMVSFSWGLDEVMHLSDRSMPDGSAKKCQEKGKGKCAHDRRVKRAVKLLGSTL